MKKVNITLLSALMALLLLVSGCKKETTIEVYFTTTEATSEVGAQPTVVDIEFSEPTKDIVELDLTSIGTDPIYFGTINQSFLHDDSLKCRAEISSNAFIDSSGHLKIGRDVKTVRITLTPQNDNFPHAQAEYKMQISNAKNATIRSGSDVFTFRLNENDAATSMVSTLFYRGIEHTAWSYNDTTTVDTLLPQTGIFELTSYGVYRNNVSPPTYDVRLAYGRISGSTKTSSINIRFPNLPKPVSGANIFDCSNTQVDIVWNVPAVMGVPSINTETLGCADLSTNNISLQVQEFSNEIYGPYYKFTGAVDFKKDTTYSFSGSLNSDFVLFN